ncbi:MFS aflatoxin efflux pump [Colletotrichum tofieldiae]|nr:MFS aflatoxin efflux pump [Colletotrichum tofieldiae]
MIFGVCLMAIGAGLMYTLQVNTGSRQWIGYQIIYGLGAGSATQAPNIAAQTVLPKRDVPIGVSLMYFGNFMSSAILLPLLRTSSTLSFYVVCHLFLVLILRRFWITA